jgi:hypothetical protein
MTPLPMILCAAHIRLHELNLGMAGRIFVKFGMDVMPLEAAPNWGFLISYPRHYQRDGCLKSSGGTMMTPLPMILCACLSRF